MSLSAQNIALPEGTYYWRVKTVEGVEPPVYTAANMFEIKPFTEDYKVTLTSTENVVTQNIHAAISTTLNKFLKGDTSYSWQVTADGAVTDDTRSFTTLDVIDAPLTASVSYDSATNSVTITWSSVLNALGYKVLYKTDYTGGYIGTGLTLDVEGLLPADSPITTDENTFSITLFNLLPQTAYWFAVQAIGENGDSTPIEISRNIIGVGTSGSATAGKAPSDLNLVVNQSNHVINLTWTQEE